jgi:hypothetical protein
MNGQQTSGILMGPLLPPPDELSLCSEEVRKVFGGSSGWLVGTPTMAQLSLDLRKLAAAVERLEETVRRRDG